MVDLGEGDTPLSYVRGNVLAGGKALYRGHAVAAVAATSAHIAEEAAGLIEVDYEVLPCVLTAPEAMQDDAPILHDDLEDQGIRRADRTRQQRLRALPPRDGRYRAGLRRKPTWSSSASSTPPPSTRATSSRTTPRRCGITTAASWSGAARRARSWCAT